MRMLVRYVSNISLEGIEGTCMFSGAAKEAKLWPENVINNRNSQ